MGRWLRPVVGVALVVLVAAAGIVASFGLLRLTQDSQDPVGKLSPRAVFAQSTSATPSSTTATVEDRDDSSSDGHDGDD